LNVALSLGIVGFGLVSPRSRSAVLVDIQTLIFCNFLVTAGLSLTYAFYRVTQKTYNGFSFWTAAIFADSLAYFVSILHASGHLVVLGAATIDILLVVGATLRLDGVHRFLRSRTLPRWIYRISVLFIFSIAAGFVIIDSLWVRSFASCLPICATSLVGSSLLWGARVHSSSRGLHRIAAFWYFGPALTSLLRVLAVAYPNAGAAAPFVGILSELSFGFLMLILTAGRVSEDLSEAKEQSERKLAELGARSTELRVLKGLLRICPECKKIENEQGQWEAVERIVSDRSSAEFTHTICPDCVRLLYPEDADDILSKSSCS